MWTGEATEATIFPSHAQYPFRSQTDKTFERNQENLLINKMATIENLPQELIANSIAEEPSIFDYLNHSDKTNFSIALAGTIHEEFVTQKFLKPQLKIFASLPSFNDSLRNEGWFEDCEDTKLIVRLWKEFKPSLPGMNTFDLDFTHFEKI